jgi:hypothetical protein
MKLTKAMREYFRSEGSKGGKTAAANLTPEQRTERARKAALALAAKRKAKRK